MKTFLLQYLLVVMCVKKRIKRLIFVIEVNSFVLVLSALDDVHSVQRRHRKINALRKQSNLFHLRNFSNNPHIVEVF